MKRTALLGKAFLLAITTILLISCRTSSIPSQHYRELARASVRLGMEIDRKDNHALYIESSRWIGTPYRSGGNTQRGTDCSGMASQIYSKVYRTTLHRTAEEQRKYDCRKVKKGKLREGDLVFFHNGRNRKRASHVGIYLKDGRFIHASSSRGVIVSRLNEEYYRKHWLAGGQVK